MVEIMNELFNEAKRRKLVQMYYIMRNDFGINIDHQEGKMKEKILEWRKKIPGWDEHELADEYVIPANTLPPYEYQKAIIGHRTYDVDLVIRSGFLKQQYRS